MTGPGLLILGGTAVIALILWGLRAACKVIVREYTNAISDFIGGYGE